jgi:hypothetical protein
MIFRRARASKGLFNPTGVPERAEWQLFSSSLRYRHRRAVGSRRYLVAALGPDSDPCALACTFVPVLVPTRPITASAVSNAERNHLRRNARLLGVQISRPAVACRVRAAVDRGAAFDSSCAYSPSYVRCRARRRAHSMCKQAPALRFELDRRALRLRATARSHCLHHPCYVHDTRCDSAQAPSAHARVRARS